MTHFNFFATGLLCSLLALAGCVGVVPAPDNASAQEQRPLVVAGLSEDLIFEYLLGDVAARRGDPVTAAQAMARAAALSGNARITVRAFALAIEVGEFERALELSELLISITPEDPGALTMRLQALIMLNRGQAVFDALVKLIDTMPEKTAVLLKHIVQILGQQADPGRWLDLMQRIATHYSELDSAQWATA
ncbi:MAG: hypothetical protein H8E30_01665, partial [Alphaproteobacteria bacterium]|nr:hypothetical protein [Alphaproteobacteria bacterium]